MYRLPFELTDSAKLLHFTILGAPQPPLNDATGSESIWHCEKGWLDSRVVSVLDSGTEGNRHCATCIGTLSFPTAATIETFLRRENKSLLHCVLFYQQQRFCCVDVIASKSRVVVWDTGYTCYLYCIRYLLLGAGLRQNIGYGLPKVRCWKPALLKLVSKNRGPY